MTHKYRDPQDNIDAHRKVSWVAKQASNENPAGLGMQMRLATPRPTGKMPGMGGIAKNPFNNTGLKKVTAPKPPPIPKIAEEEEEVYKEAGYSHEYYMRNRQRIKQRNREYRLRNAAKIRLQRKRYRRELKSGARRKARRIRSGSQYITYGGF